MIIVPIILFIILFYCWFNKRYEWTLIILTTFFTEGYGFIPSCVFAIKSYDYVNVFLIIASIIGYMKDKSFFNIKKGSGDNSRALFSPITQRKSGPDFLFFFSLGASFIIFVDYKTIVCIE